MKNIVKHITKLQESISKILNSSLTFTEAIEESNYYFLNFIKRLEVFKNENLFHVELEIITSTSELIGNLYCTSDLDDHKGKIFFLKNIQFPVEVTFINNLEKTDFIEIELHEELKGKLVFPIYLPFDEKRQVLSYLLIFDKVTDFEIIEYCLLISELIRINSIRIITYYQKIIADKIDSVGFNLSDQIYQSKIDIELKYISKIIEQELGYDLCDFMIQYPQELNKLKYIHTKSITNSGYDLHLDKTSLAIKSFKNLIDIKLISAERIKAFTNRNLIADIENQFNKTQKSFKKLNKWISIVIKGRNQNPIGLIKIFQFEGSNNSFFSLSCHHFLILKSIQRTIYHIMMDNFILQNEINSRNAVIDNLMHQVISPLGALVEHCKNVLKGHHKKDYNVYEKLNYIKNLSHECSDKAKSFQSLINFEHGTLKAKIIRVYDIRMEIMKKIIDFQPKALTDKGVQIFLDIDNSSPAIPAYIDSSLFSHIISNLIDNSMKYSFDRIDRKEMGFTELPKKINDPANILLSIKKRQSQIIITISNLGAPIMEEEREKIFDRKYRGQYSNDYSYIGNGLGLYIVRKFLRLMNSEIKYLQQNNKYISTFKIVLNDQ